MLNHPHIAQIFGVEVTDAARILMELFLAAHANALERLLAGDT